MLNDCSLSAWSNRSRHMQRSDAAQPIMYLAFQVAASYTSTHRRIIMASTATAPNKPASATGTVRLHRVLRAPAERVYKAFLDPDAMVKWVPPHGFTGKVHSMDARVGGGYKM